MVLKGQEVEENNKFVPLNRTLADRYFEKLRPLMIRRIFTFEGLPESLPNDGGNADYSSRLDEIDFLKIGPGKLRDGDKG